MRFALVLLVIAFFNPGLSHAQMTGGPQSLFESAPSGALQLEVGTYGVAPPLWLVAPQTPPDLGRILLGSALGLAAGGAAGAGLGYLIYQLSDPPDGDMFGGVFTVAAGAALGGAIGSWAGVRWANDSRGNPWITAAGAVVGVAGGVGLGLLLGAATESTIVGFAVAIPIAITLPALAEYFTTPR